MDLSYLSEDILLEHYCILCRNTVPREDTVHELHTEPWEEEMLCFIHLPRPDDPSRHRVLTYRTRAPIAPSSAPKSIEQELDKEGKHLCMNAEIGCCSLQHTANLVHLPCLQLAKQKFPGITIKLLCQITKCMQPLVAWGVSRNISGPLRSLPDFVKHGLSRTDLGLLIEKAKSQLPGEIENMLCECLPPSYFSTVAGCLETLDWLSEWNFESQTRHSLQALLNSPLSGYQEIEKIGANLVCIMGEYCLAEVGANPTARYDRIVPLAKGKSINGLYFALGKLGVTSLRFQYEDNTKTPWLGQDSPKWTRFLKGNNMHDLQTQSDGFKIISLVFKGAKPTAEGENFLWDQEVDFSPGLKWSLLDIGPSGPTALPVRGNPNTRFAHYLHFDLNDGKRHSLTVFANLFFISCIQIDGSPKKRLGRPCDHSCSITFELEPFETTRSIHFLLRRSKDPFFAQGPYILMTTSRARSLYYGPYLVQSMRTKRGHISTPAFEATHSVSGIFCDAIKSDTDRLIGLGTVWGPNSPDTSEPPPVPSVPAPGKAELERLILVKHPRDAFLTKAAFYGATTLYIQKRGRRCIGILAEMGDGSRTILGQWDPSRKGNITIFYEKRNGPLDQITFILSDGDAEEKNVEDIVHDCDVTKPHFTWSDLRREITWFFTDQYDSLAYWTGETQRNLGKSNAPFTTGGW